MTIVIYVLPLIKFGFDVFGGLDVVGPGGSESRDAFHSEGIASFFFVSSCVIQGCQNKPLVMRWSLSKRYSRNKAIKKNTYSSLSFPFLYSKHSTLYFP